MLNSSGKLEGEFLKIVEGEQDFTIHWVDASGKIRWTCVAKYGIDAEREEADEQLRRLHMRLNGLSDRDESSLPVEVEAELELRKQEGMSDLDEADTIRLKMQFFEIQALWPVMYKAYCKGQSLDTFFEKSAQEKKESARTGRLKLTRNKRETLNDRIVAKVHSFIDQGKGTFREAFIFLAANSKKLLKHELSAKAIEGRYYRTPKERRTTER